MAKPGKSESAHFCAQCGKRLAGPFSRCHRCGAWFAGNGLELLKIGITLLLFGAVAWFLIRWLVDS